MKKPKTRLLGVRITAEQMQELEERALADGARNLSDWARKQLLENPHYRAVLQAGINQLEAEAHPPISLADPGQVAGAAPSGQAETPASEPAPRRSWAEEWAEMERMTMAEAHARFTELCTEVRRANPTAMHMPDGFAGWEREDKIEWLDRWWTL